MNENNEVRKAYFYGLFLLQTSYIHIEIHKLYIRQFHSISCLRGYESDSSFPILFDFYTDFMRSKYVSHLLAYNTHLAPGWFIPTCYCYCLLVRTTSGDDCVFPFTYDGVEYKHCTTVDQDRSWCATVSSINNFNNANRWGYCDITCKYITATCQ